MLTSYFTIRDFQIIPLFGNEIAAIAISYDEVLKEYGSICGCDCCPPGKEFGYSHLGEYYVKVRTEIHMPRLLENSQNLGERPAKDFAW